MATRRMFAREVCCSDAFQAMSFETQALYFHLGIEADDDGFLSGALRIARGIGLGEQSLDELVTCGFLLHFASGVYAITHWRVSNSIRKDRYIPTIHKAELQQLFDVPGQPYSWLPDGCQVVATGEDRIRKGIEEEVRGGETTAHGQHGNVFLKPEELLQLQNKRPHDWEAKIEHLSAYMAETGKRYEDHLSVLLRWASEDDRKAAANPAGQFQQRASNYSGFAFSNDEWEAGDSI